MKDAILTQLLAVTFARVSDAHNEIVRYKANPSPDHLVIAEDVLRFALESLAGIEKRLEAMS